MFRKFLTLLGSIGVVAIASTSVVSCIAPGYANGEDGQRVVLATDGGKITDHSFNEDAYVGVTKFLKQTYDLPSNHSYVEARDSDINSIVSGYRLADLKGANAVVLPGFSHMSSLATLGPNLGFLKNINVVLVDGVNTSSNVVSLQFNSQISGVLAGFDTSYWATTFGSNGKMLGDASGDGKITLGTFAGASNKYGVDNYMWGLLLGMQIYNEWVQSGTPVPKKDGWYTVKNPTTGIDEQRSIVYSGNVGGKIENVDVTTPTDASYFTNSFALGGAEQSGILGRLINTNQSDVIFPVAGPQIQDVINHTASYKPYLIGIDVDQAATYTSAAQEGRFVTSAIKNIDTAVPEALYRAQSKDQEGNVTRANTLKFTTPEQQEIYKKENPNDDAWLGKQPDPYVNWSIDYTNDNLGLNNSSPYKYKIDHNWLSLYDPKNVMESAPEYTAMWDINNYFAKLGQTSPEYMQGINITTLAKWLWQTFGSNWQDALLTGKDGQGQTKSTDKWLSWTDPDSQKRYLVPNDSKGNNSSEQKGS